MWVDDHFAGAHEGSFTPFSIDITDLLAQQAGHTIIVRAEDDPHELAQPRGKQDWQLQPHAIWYPRTTGIWQTVWLERRPPSWIDSLRWSPGLASWDIACEAVIAGKRRDGLRLEVILSVPGPESARILAHDVYSVVSNEVHRRIALSELRPLDQGGSLIDEVASYTALRAVGVEQDRFILNGRPLPLRIILDQGYWPESGMTAPDNAALRRDVELEGDGVQWGAQASEDRGSPVPLLG